MQRCSACRYSVSEPGNDHGRHGRGLRGASEKKPYRAPFIQSKQEAKAQGKGIWGRETAMRDHPRSGEGWGVKP